MGSKHKARTCVRALAALACAMSPSHASAAPTSVPARARAVTITPLSLLKTGDLSFGNLIAATVAGSVTVNATTDAPTYVGVSGSGGTIAAARFIGAGTAGQLVNVTWTPGPIVLTRIGGGATMQMDTLRSNGGLVFGANDIRVIPASRVLDIRFGARLLVAANQADGSYEGSFTVTADYL